MAHPKSTRPESIPTFDELLLPTICALRDLGGSATVDELADKVAVGMLLSDDVISFRRDGASTNEVPYRLAWARTYLKKDGILDRTSRGVWALTARGRDIADEDVRGVLARVRKRRSEEQLRADADDDASIQEEVASEQSWKSKLIAVLLALPPPSFERLAQRILRESGFIKVEVTGRAGDGGIDGVGVLRIQLISFHVLFQCKRYKEAVSLSAIRDFRGAMVGRSDKGLFITTGRFTAEARREGTRDGAPPIELVYGEELCELLRALRIGVSVEERYVVHPTVFAEL